MQPVGGLLEIQGISGAKNAPYRTPVKGNIFLLNFAYFSIIPILRDFFPAVDGVPELLCSPELVMGKRGSNRAYFDYPDQYSPKVTGFSALW